MMFALLYSSKKDHSKSIIAKEKITQLVSKKLFSIHCCIFPTQWINLDSFPYKTSYFTVKQSFLVRGLTCSIGWTPLVLIKDIRL